MAPSNPSPRPPVGRGRGWGDLIKFLIPLVLAGCGSVAEPHPPAPPSLIGSIPTPEPTRAPDAGDRLLIGTAFFHEGFETLSDAWTLEGESAGVRWRRLEGNFCGGAFAMLIGREGRASFADAEGEFLLTLAQPLDLSGRTRPHVAYDVLGSANPVDSLVLQPEARRQGGSWQAVGRETYAEYPRAVAHRFADLTAFAGGPVELRFRATLRKADQLGSGLLLDDIRVLEPTNL